MSNEQLIHDAFVQGNLDALKKALGHPPDFLNCGSLFSIGNILEYAIYHSPLSCIRALLEQGADPNYADHAGFPSLIAALSCPERPDREEIIELLLGFGADIQQRGINDYTPLHCTAVENNVRMIMLLTSHGADLEAKTHIDNYATPLEEAELLERHEAAEAIRDIMKERHKTN